jgi:hypothetical protein
MGKDLEELGPRQMQILCGWLLITSAGRLAKRGLSHLEQCPLCDQEEEAMNDLIFPGVFAHQIWFEILRGLVCNYLFHKWWILHLRIGDIW